MSLLRSSRQTARIAVSVDGHEAPARPLLRRSAGGDPGGLHRLQPLRSWADPAAGAGLLALTPINAFRPRRWRGALLPRHSRVDFTVLDPRKRPVAAAADSVEIPNVAKVTVYRGDRHPAHPAVRSRGTISRSASSRSSSTLEQGLPVKPEKKHIIGHEGLRPAPARGRDRHGGRLRVRLAAHAARLDAGACVFSTVAAFAGLRIGMKRAPAARAWSFIMGVLLGSGFSPELIHQLGRWAVSLGVLSGMTMTGATLSYFWFRRFTMWDKVTCYFAPRCRAA